METEVVRLENLEIGYTARREPPRVVGRNLNAVLRKGELVFLLGPNGAGKSTLMRTLAGMQKPLSGRVLLGGDDVHRISPKEVARRMAVVLTERLTGSVFTGYELVSMGRHPHTDWRGHLSAKDHDVIRWALSVVRSEDLAARQIAEMSDGERQRILLARALAQEPQMLILDEITAFLDVPRRVSITQILLEIVHREKRAILLSSHDLDLALRIADRVWLYPKGGEMRTGMPEELAWSGALGKAFDGDGVQFDPDSGTFRLRGAQNGLVVVRGDGSRLFWTKRALERNGYNISTDAGETVFAEVTVTHSSAGTHWTVAANSERIEMDSLEDLLAFLRRASERAPQG